MKISLKTKDGKNPSKKNPVFLREGMKLKVWEIKNGDMVVRICSEEKPTIKLVKMKKGKKGTNIVGETEYKYDI